MSEIRRVDQGRIRFRGIFKDRTESQATPQEEARLFFRRSPNEDYTFENGRVLINGMDVLSLIEGDDIDIELLVNLIGAIDEYRREVWDRYGTKHKSFNEQTQGILERALHKLSASYEGMTGGVRVRLIGGRLWINDIDPRVVLTLFLSNPTEERRRYLQSISTKLALILEGKIGNDYSHAVVEEAKGLFVQITKAFENTEASVPPLLLAGVPDFAR